VSEVAVRFGGVAALNEVSLAVKPGTVTGLIGPNGAGKTTLFNVISGLQAPGRGSVHIFETDVTSMKPHHRARLGLARTFQRLELFGSLTVGENVQVGLESEVKPWHWRPHLPRRLRRKKSGATPAAADGPLAAVDEATCDHLLAGVGLEGLGESYASSLPTGPKLLLLDEPGSGLDETESVALGDLLSTLAKGGMGVLLVEHDMELVMRICDHIYVLDFGDIIASGTPDEVRKNPVVQAAYLGEAVPEPEPEPGAVTRTADGTGTGS
jgi:branched-chain amino acid transport system ATP-binding protein